MKNVIKVNDNYGFGFTVTPDGRHSPVLLTNNSEIANTWVSGFGDSDWKFTVKLPVLADKRRYDVNNTEDSIKVLKDEIRLGIKKLEKKIDLRPSQAKYLEFLRSIV